MKKAFLSLVLGVLTTAAFAQQKDTVVTIKLKRSQVNALVTVLSFSRQAIQTSRAQAVQVSDVAAAIDELKPLLRDTTKKVTPTAAPKK